MLLLNRCVFGEASAVLATLPEGLAHCCVTSPPYWGLRDYGHPDQLGQEETPDAYVERLVAILREVRRVLRPDGTLWLNLGDSYAGARGGEQGSGGLKPKDLVGIPWRVAFALQADGWWLRSDIIWAKPNPMPENVTDRPTKAHEYVFLLSKSATYHYDANAIAEQAVSFGRQHCILAGCPLGGVVLDPFLGSGTVGMVAEGLGRAWLGIEIDERNAPLIAERTRQVGLFARAGTA